MRVQKGIQPMKKNKKTILVLGKGPVLSMTIIFVFLFMILLGAFIMLRKRDPGVAVTALVFSVASLTVAVLMMASYFRHRKDDRAREKAWEDLERYRQRHS